MSERSIVVAVDFGTTYSGVAWSESGRPEHQTVIDSWPNRGSLKESSPKVPTELRRVRHGYQWGFEIPVDSKRSREFKLKLNEPSVAWNGLTPEELTKTYLEKLYEHSMGILKASLSEDVVGSVPIHFVVTVPAIWSDKAKQATKTAAEEAGFKGRASFYMVSEPEAAAMYTLKNLDPSLRGVGSKLLVCDAGGGTVDLITYKVAQQWPVLKLEEVTQGTGSKCGSSLLNKRFRQYLKDTHEDHWTDDRLANATRIFEQYKKTWTPGAGKLFLEVDRSLGLRRNRYSVPDEHMCNRVFDPVINDVLDEIKKQISLASGVVDAVLLVGGFGQSTYLEERVKAEVPGVSVIMPENAWTAVVRGAALLGMGRVAPASTRVSVDSRVARAHYGFETYETNLDFSTQPQDKIYRHHLTGELAVDMMKWFIRKGESYSANSMSSSFPVILKLPDRAVDGTSFGGIFYIDATERTAPVYPDNIMHRVGYMSIDSAKVLQLGPFERLQIGGVWFNIVPSTVHARLESATVAYALKVKGIIINAIAMGYY